MSTTADRDPIAALERELVDAAHRQALTDPAERREPEPEPEPRIRPSRPLSLPLTIAAVLIPVVAVCAAVLLTRAPAPGSHPLGNATTPQSRHRLSLLGELAVLRRPQRASDHLGQPGPEILHSPEFRYSGAPAGIVPALARHATVTLPGGGRAGVALTVYGALKSRSGLWLSISVALPTSPRSPDYQAPESARAIATSGELTALGDGLVVGVVPDQVARVWVVSPGPQGSRVWPVHDNVVALRLPRHTGGTMEWLDRRGRIIRRVPFSGGRSVTQTVTPPPLPAVLAVLRRPRTAADVVPPSLRALGAVTRPGAAAAMGLPQFGQSRLAATAPWGAKVFLVPSVPLSDRAAAHLNPTAKAQWRSGVRRGETLGILTPNGGGIGADLANIVDGSATYTSLADPGPGRLPALRVIQVVPDGVAWVRFDLSGPPSYSGPRHPLVEVTDNLAMLELPRAGGAALGGAPHWLGADRRPWRNPYLATAPTAPTARTAPAPPARASTPPSGDDLTRALGVLRRPQTAADRTLPQLHGHPPFDLALGTPDRAGARLATTAPWGRRIYVVPFTPPGATGQILDVFGMGGPQTMSGAAAFSAAQIDTGQAILDQRTRRRLRVLTVVPDRVRAITLTLPDAVGGTDRIVGNVATVELINPSASGRGRITWRDARGRPIASFPWALGSG